MLRWQFVLVGVVALTLTACQKNAQPAATPAETFQPPTASDTSSTNDDLYAREPATSDPYASDPYATDPYVTSSSTPTARPARTTPPEEVVVAGDSKAGRTHVVKKGDTLYSLARQYYGNQSKWKAIYDANRSKISKPDKLQVGQTLVIP